MSYATTADIKVYLPMCSLPSLTNEGDPAAITVDEDVISTSLEAAQAEMDSSIVAQYDLTSSHAVKPPYLKHMQAILACVWICRLSANGTVPPGLQSQYEEKIQQLMEIKLGQRMVPGLAVRSDPGVSMSNLTHDPRWDATKIRTRPMINTGDQNSVVPRNTNYIPSIY